MTKRHRQARRLPEPNGPRGHLIGMTVLGYTIGSWCPTPDGSGPATAVCLQVAISGMPDMFLRLNSPAAVEEMIAALERHKADVWPEVGN